MQTCKYTQHGVVGDGGRGEGGGGREGGGEIDNNRCSQ